MVVLGELVRAWKCAVLAQLKEVLRPIRPRLISILECIYFGYNAGEKGKIWFKDTLEEYLSFICCGM